MARRVVVLCDVHLEEGTRVEAAELPPITVEGNGPRVLALCEEHKRDYYDPFVELVEDLGLDSAEEGTSKAIPDDSAADPAHEDPDADEETGDDPQQVVDEAPTMTAVSGDTARWDCPVDDCDKSYSASGEHRAEDLKRLGNLHLSTAHGLDKGARQEMLSA